MRKNTTGQYVAFQAISKTDGSDVITGTPVVYYTIDGGTQAQTTATAVHEGNGQWSVALSQAETNGDHIVFSFVLTGAVTQTVNVYTLDADLTNLDVAVSTRSTVAATDIVSGGAITTSGGAVSNVTLVATTTTNTDMRGTDGANTVAPDNASIAAILVDTGTDIPASIAALNDFNPSTDTVSNVTTVGSVTNPVTTDAASRTASQADVSALATSAEIAALNDLSQADVRTAVGLASANLDTQLGDIPTVSEFNARTLVASAYFDPTTDAVTVGTNNDKTDYALSAASRQAIGDDFLSHVITKGSAGTIERAFWQSLKATQLADGEVSGTPTASAFDTNLTAVTGAYDHLLILFTSGSLAGEARPISSYSATNGRITLQEPLTAAPSSTDEFIVVPDHSHPVSEIVEAVFNEPQSGYSTAGTFGYYIDAQVSSAGGGATASEIADAVWDETRTGHTTAGTFGYYLDDRVSQVGGGGGASAADIWGALLSDYAVSGTFGARFQEADRYTNTTAQIRYVTQGDAYDDTANNAIEWSVAKDYSGASSITLTIEHRVTGATLLTHAVTYIDASTLKAYLSSSDTAFSQLTTDADFGVHPYTVVASYSGELETIVNGAISIKQS